MPRPTLPTALLAVAASVAWWPGVAPEPWVVPQSCRVVSVPVVAAVRPEAPVVRQQVRRRLRLRRE